MKSNTQANRISPWTLTQLALELRNDLAQCTNNFERLNCKAICVSEMRELAQKLMVERKLTPGEQAIYEEYGIN